MMAELDRHYLLILRSFSSSFRVIDDSCTAGVKDHWTRDSETRLSSPSRAYLHAQLRGFKFDGCQCRSAYSRWQPPHPGPLAGLTQTPFGVRKRKAGTGNAWARGRGGGRGGGEAKEHRHLMKIA